MRRPSFPSILKFFLLFSKWLISAKIKFSKWLFLDFLALQSFAEYVDLEPRSGSNQPLVEFVVYQTSRCRLIGLNLELKFSIISAKILINYHKFSNLCYVFYNMYLPEFIGRVLLTGGVMGGSGVFFASNAKLTDFIGPVAPSNFLLFSSIESISEAKFSISKSSSRSKLSSSKVVWETLKSWKMFIILYCNE